MQQHQEEEAEEEDQEAAKRDFLQLILSTLASAASIDSEAAAGVNSSIDAVITAASPAQLAAAASLPRAPSVQDLAVFAAAAGLPFETVTQAAASSRLSVTTDAQGGTSTTTLRGSSFRLVAPTSNGGGSSGSGSGVAAPGGGLPPRSASANSNSSNGSPGRRPVSAQLPPPLAAGTGADPVTTGTARPSAVATGVAADEHSSILTALGGAQQLLGTDLPLTGLSGRYNNLLLATQQQGTEEEEGPRPASTSSKGIGLTAPAGPEQQAVGGLEEEAAVSAAAPVMSAETHATASTTAIVSAYPSVPEIQPSSPTAADTGASAARAPSNRLSDVLAAARQSSLRRPSLSLSRASSGALPVGGTSSNSSSNNSMMAAVLAPAAGAALATSGAAAAAAATAGTTVATVGVAATVFALRQAAGLFQFGGRVAASAVMAAPKAAAWAWDLAQAHRVVPDTTSATRRHSVSTAATSSSSSSPLWSAFTGLLTPAPAQSTVEGPTPHTAASPASADMHAAQAAVTSSSNESSMPPSLGGIATHRWAPSAGRSTAASVAVVMLTPLALLLQWPARTATILFEVWIWGMLMLAGSFLAVPLGLLRYLGLLPQRLVLRNSGPPAATSSAQQSTTAGGGFAAQRDNTAWMGNDDDEGQTAPAGAVGAPASSLSLLTVTVVPEEHEVVGDDVMSPTAAAAAASASGGGAAGGGVVPPTPAPSMEAPSSSSGGAQRTWSMSFLSAALSRLGSSTGLTQTPTPTTPSDSNNSNATPAEVPASAAAASSPGSVSGLTGPRVPRSLSRLSKGAAVASRPAAATVALSTPGAAASLVSRSSSSDTTNSSISRTSSSNSGSTGGGSRLLGSRWLSGRRVAASTPAGLQRFAERASAQAAATTGQDADVGGAGSRSWWWPSWAQSGADTTTPTAATAGPTDSAPLTHQRSGSFVMPATPPPTPMFTSFSDSTRQLLSPTTSPSAAAAAGSQAATGGMTTDAAGVAAGAIQGSSHLWAAVSHATQAFVLLVLQPGMWLAGALLQLVHDGVATAAWLAGWAIWWALLPARLAWWGLVLPGRVAYRMCEGVMWVAGRGQTVGV